MREAERDHAREILHEAFAAGWQAALALTITNPRVLAVIESCFEEWLAESADETDVLGLMFRSRDDLPRPTWRAASLLTAQPDEDARHLVPVPAPSGDAGLAGDGNV